MAHDANQEICLQHGGILPEPRSQEENEFLNDLNTDMFVLGLSDVEIEGSWLYDSDRSTVAFTNWHPGQPRGGTGKNCAVMRNFANGGAFWSDVPCLSDGDLNAFNMSLICQKTKGLCVVIFSINSI